MYFDPFEDSVLQDINPQYQIIDPFLADAINLAQHAQSQECDEFIPFFDTDDIDFPRDRPSTTTRKYHSLKNERLLSAYCIGNCHEQ